MVTNNLGRIRKDILLLGNQVFFADNIDIVRYKYKLV